LSASLSSTGCKSAFRSCRTDNGKPKYVHGKLTT
jgi:hypothetical protein